MGTTGHELAGVHILLVEDNADTLEVVTLILRYAGALVMTATRARDALAILERVVPNLVLTDLGMPEHDGFWLLREIRTIPRLNRLPVVALTAQAHQDERVRALNAGFQSYLPKPVEMNDLVATVVRLVARDSQQ